MWRLAWAQLVHRGSRSLAMGLGLLVACAGFTVLTSQSSASRLQVVGTVEANARSAYDILVRPTGSALPLETSNRLVRAGFLSGNHGGISLGQWRKIQQISGVEVAAPVAVVGYVVPKIQIPVFADSRIKTGSKRDLLRLDTTWHTDNGASKIEGRPTFVYVTPHELATVDDEGTETQVEISPDGQHVLTRGLGQPLPWVVEEGPTRVEYRTSASYQAQDGGLGSLSDPVFAFPFLVQAIDPVSEAKLAGLDKAVTRGKYLSLAEPKSLVTGNSPAKSVPVLVASTPATHIGLSYRMMRLATSAADRVGKGQGVDSQLEIGGRVIASGSVDQDKAYQLLLKAMTRGAPTDYFARQLSYLYNTGPTTYMPADDAEPGRLQARTVHNRREVWAVPGAGDAFGTWIPAGADDTAFREVSGYKWATTGSAPPVFVKSGVFDPSMLPEYSELSAVPLGTYASSVLTGATAQDKQVLDSKPLAPSPNIAGYPQPAPLMLTSLSALGAFQGTTSTGGFSKLPGDKPDAPSSPVPADAPISSIRVRAAGVSGVDELSRQRVRLVAQQISEQTGLKVDITVGSSPSPQTIDLAAGQHGRPPVSVVENWVQKGTALAILKSVDRKSLALFVLLLVVCGLFVANAAAASVRARRSELGMLACLGWPRSRLFGLVVIELVIIAVCAGVGGAIVSLGIGAALGVPVGAGRALLAVPAALVVALIAGIIPAKVAADAPPMEAVQPAVNLTRRAHEPRSVLALAWVSVSRTRTRSILAAGGFAVAVAALTVIVGILAEFKGAVVGTLLGNAVTVEVRGADYVAVVAILLLAAIGVANVMFLNIRERGKELATLRALGWSDGTLTWLLLAEGLMIGLAGAIGGGALGLGILAVLLGSPSASLVLTALGAVGAGLAMTGLASLGPALSIARLPTARLLTEE